MKEIFLKKIFIVITVLLIFSAFLMFLFRGEKLLDFGPFKDYNISKVKDASLGYTEWSFKKDDADTKLNFRVNRFGRDLGKNDTLSLLGPFSTAYERLKSSGKGIVTPLSNGEIEVDGEKIFVSHYKMTNGIQQTVYKKASCYVGGFMVTLSGTFVVNNSENDNYNKEWDDFVRFVIRRLKNG